MAAALPLPWWCAWLSVAVAHVWRDTLLIARLAAVCRSFDEHTRRGGRSGKWANEELLALMTGVADTYRARITFVFVDGIKFADRMRSVGLSGTPTPRAPAPLHPAASDPVARAWRRLRSSCVCVCVVAGAGGKSALPGLAFNLMDSRVLPYDASRGISTKSMSRFCNEFLAGKLTPLDRACWWLRGRGGAGGRGVASYAHVLLHARWLWFRSVCGDGSCGGWPREASCTRGMLCAAISAGLCCMGTPRARCHVRVCG